MSTVLSIVSGLVGWSYVICWATTDTGPNTGSYGAVLISSVSLYPPVVLNHKLRSVEGVSLDFVLLNAVGYLTYSFSLSMLYFSVVVRNEYAQRHTLAENGQLKFPLVRFNDIAYAYHGLALVSYMVYQVYGAGYTRSPRQHIGRFTKVLLIGGGLGAVGLVAYALAVQSHKLGPSMHQLQMLDVATILGHVKLIMSVSKYIPQVLWNHKRRSTKGWSIGAVRMDILGSVLALLQLVLDGYIRHDFKGILNNSVKLALAGVTLLFDGIFVLQHYVLYREPEADLDMRNLSELYK